MSESVFLTKEMLLSTKDVLAIEKVELTRGHVYVREMTAKEKDTWERSLRKEVPVIGGQRGKAGTEMALNLTDYRAKLAVCTMCNQSGELLFDMTPNTIKALGEQMSAANMETVVDVANRLNKITQEDQEALVKNSEADLSASSSSDSAEN